MIPDDLLPFYRHMMINGRLTRRIIINNMDLELISFNTLQERRCVKHERIYMLRRDYLPSSTYLFNARINYVRYKVTTDRRPFYAVSIKELSIPTTIMFVFGPQANHVDYYLFRNPL